MSGCLGDEKMIVQKKTKVPVPGTSTLTVTVQYYPVHVHMHMYTFRLLGSVTLVYMSCTMCVVQIQELQKFKKLYSFNQRWYVFFMHDFLSTLFLFQFCCFCLFKETLLRLLSLFACLHFIHG